MREGRRTVAARKAQLLRLRKEHSSDKLAAPAKPLSTAEKRRRQTPAKRPPPTAAPSPPAHSARTLATSKPRLNTTTYSPVASSAAEALPPAAASPGSRAQARQSASTAAAAALRGGCRRRGGGGRCCCCAMRDALGVCCKRLCARWDAELRGGSRQGRTCRRGAVGRGGAGSAGPLGSRSCRERQEGMRRPSKTSASCKVLSSPSLAHPWQLQRRISCSHPIFSSVQQHASSQAGPRGRLGLGARVPDPPAPLAPGGSAAGDLRCAWVVREALRTGASAWTGQGGGRVLPPPPLLPPAPCASALKCPF